MEKAIEPNPYKLKKKIRIRNINQIYEPGLSEMPLNFKFYLCIIILYQYILWIISML
jgi:hypothetical protein